jgi:4'-phosphopantetheinyl transferase EntD
MPDGKGLLAALTSALPAGLAAAMDDPDLGPHGLLPPEALIRAVPRRLSEFAAGRRAARAAMAKLGLPAMAVPHGPDRAPVWPAGVAGSISHTKGLCVAIVGRAHVWAGLGLDIEPDHGLDVALWSDILRPSETARIDDLPPGSQGSAAMAVFLAKEAAYKAQYPISRTLFAFQDVEVGVDGERFVAVLTRDVPGLAKGTAIPGQFCRADGYVAAFCAIRQVQAA